MTVTASNMLPLGSRAANFELYDTISGEYKSLAQLRGKKATVILFICNHCPFVQHIDPELVRLGKDYYNTDVAIIAISANDPVSHPEDGVDEMSRKAKNLGYAFPYLYDETQKIAKAYKAACTPDCYLFNEDLLCIYRGQFDDSRPGNNKPVTGKDLRQAIEHYLKGVEITEPQIPSMGCNIKWKS